MGVNKIWTGAVSRGSFWSFLWLRVDYSGLLATHLGFHLTGLNFRVSVRMSNVRVERFSWGCAFRLVRATLGYFLWVRAGLRIEVGSGSARN